MKTKSEIWFEKLRDIWLRQAAEEVGELVADEFEYFEDPFDGPITNLTDLVNEWQEVKTQEIKMLEIVSLTEDDTKGFAKYHFVSSIDGQKYESKGAYFVHLNSEGKAVEFRQWWNEKD